MVFETLMSGRLTLLKLPTQSMHPGFQMVIIVMFLFNSQIRITFVCKFVNSAVIISAGCHELYSVLQSAIREIHLSYSSHTSHARTDLTM